MDHILVLDVSNINKIRILYPNCAGDITVHMCLHRLRYGYTGGDQAQRQRRWTGLWVTTCCASSYYLVNLVIGQ